MSTIHLIPALASIGDPEGTRTLTSIVALLVAIGVALLLLAVWIYRTTRPDPELLAPLEAMGERSWRRGDPVWQRRRLDELRPVGAKPLAPSVAPPELDVSFDDGPTASGFDDLRADAPVGADTITNVDGIDFGADDRDGDGRDVDTGGPADDPTRATTAGVGATEDGETSAGDGLSSDVATPDATPAGVVGALVESFADDDFDPDALAAARDELDRELADSSGRSSAQRERDLLGGGRDD